MMIDSGRPRQIKLVPSAQVMGPDGPRPNSSGWDVPYAFVRQVSYSIYKSGQAIDEEQVQAVILELEKRGHLILSPPKVPCSLTNQTEETK